MGEERYYGIQGRDGEGTSAPRTKNVLASKPLPACMHICIYNPGYYTPQSHVACLKTHIGSPKKI